MLPQARSDGFRISLDFSRTGAWGPRRYFHSGACFGGFFCEFFSGIFPRSWEDPRILSFLLKKGRKKQKKTKKIQKNTKNTKNKQKNTKKKQEKNNPKCALQKKNKKETRKKHSEMGPPKKKKKRNKKNTSPYELSGKIPQNTRKNLQKRAPGSLSQKKHLRMDILHPRASQNGFVIGKSFWASRQGLWPRKRFSWLKLN